MRKFAAHYVLTETGDLLRNGLAEVAPNGQVTLIDTKGSLIEIERLIFHSGLLIKGFEYIRNTQPSAITTNQSNAAGPLFSKILQSELVSLPEVFELAKQLQEVYPNQTVPQLLSHIDYALTEGNAYSKSAVSGLYLLSSLDLSTLRFKPSSRLKRIV